MSHERSETVQDPQTGKWVNVYGRETRKAGERLPQDDSGFGHKEYDTVDDAVAEAKKRSESIKPKMPPAFAGGGRVSGFLDEVRSSAGLPAEEDLTSPDTVGSFVGDKRRVSDEQNLEILKRQRGDSNDDPSFASELDREIKRVERRGGAAPISQNYEKSSSTVRSGGFLADVDAAIKSSAVAPTKEDTGFLAKVRQAVGGFGEGEFGDAPQQRQGASMPPAQAPVRDIQTGEEMWDEHQRAPYTGEGGVLTNLPAGFVAQAKNALAGFKLMMERQGEQNLRTQQAEDDPSLLDTRDIRARAAPRRPKRSFGLDEGIVRVELPPEQLQAAIKDATEAGARTQKWVQETQREVELVTPRDMDLFQKMVWSGVTSSGQTLLGIGVGIATRNPALAMAVAGAGGFQQQAGSSYAEALDSGASHRTAMRSAIRQGFVETLDMLPVGYALSNPATRRTFADFLLKTLKTGGVEGGTEAVQQALQDFDAYASYKPEMTLGEAWENFVVAAGAGFLIGVAIGGAGHAMEPTKGDLLAKAIREGVAGSEWTKSAEEVARDALRPENAQIRMERKEPVYPATELTHRLEDGTAVKAHVEEGKPVPGLWVDANGELIEAPRAEPNQTEPNATWKIGGTEYDVEVTGKGTARDTARLADGQEVPITQLQLDEDAKVLLGLAEPKEKPAAPKSEGAEIPPPRGATPPTEAAGPQSRIEWRMGPPTGKPTWEKRDSEKQKQYMERLRKRGEARKKVMVETDGITDAIIKLGGLKNDLRLEVTGERGSKAQKQLPFVGYLFNARGKNLDEMALQLQEYGYLTQADIDNAKDTGGTRLLAERIAEELSGATKHYSEFRSDKAREAELQEEETPPNIVDVDELDQPAYMDEADAALADDMQREAGAEPAFLVTPEELAADGLEPTGERLAIVDLLRQLPEDVQETLAIAHAESSEAETLAAIKAALKEQENGEKGTPRSTEAVRAGEETRPAAERQPAEGAKPAAEVAATPDAEARPEGGPGLTDKGRAAAGKYPVPKSEWAKVGDTVRSPAGMLGVVQRIVKLSQYTSATVKWENGSVGRHHIAHLTVVEEPKGRAALARETPAQWIKRLQKKYGAKWRAKADQALNDLERELREVPLAEGEHRAWFNRGESLRQSFAHVTELRHAISQAGLREQEVKVKAVEAETGREVELTQDAAAALKDVDERIAKTLELIECVRS